VCYLLLENQTHAIVEYSNLAATRSPEEKSITRLLIKAAIKNIVWEVDIICKMLLNFFSFVRVTQSAAILQLPNILHMVCNTKLAINIYLTALLNSNISFNLFDEIWCC
jgi:hypothetical protein